MLRNKWRTLFCCVFICTIYLVSSAPSKFKFSSTKEAAKPPRKNSFDGQQPYAVFTDKGSNRQYNAYLTKGKIATPNSSGRKDCIDCLDKARKKGFDFGNGKTIIQGDKTKGVRLDSQLNVGSRHSEPFSNLQLQQNGQRPKGQSSTYGQVYGPTSFFKNKDNAYTAFKKSLDSGQGVQLRTKE